MTKLRHPLTIENALYSVLGLIGIDRAAEVTGREAHYVRSLSDPDNRYRLTMEDALKLDLAFAESGGQGAPLYETYGLLLGAARAERFTCEAQIARHTVDVIKEGGQAHAALVALTIPGATEADRRHAAKEVEEAAQALIRGIDEAVELSLAENLQQRTMSPVDEFFAFAELMKRGDTSPAQLAKRFGFSERVVKQRLRLAELAGPILEALAERQITLDAAMAYATSQDRALQAEVFHHQSKRGRTAHDPANVRLSLRMKGMDTADRMYRFIGAAAYEREGGAYEDDLFNEAGKDRVLAQPFVAETLANTMVDFQAARLVEDLRHDDHWATTIAGFVKVPDLRLHSYGTVEKMRPPAGFVLVEKAESDKLWRTIRNNGLNAHVVVGLDVAGQLIADHRYAFVPLGQKGAIEKPALADVAVDRERNAAAERERQIIRWSRRLAVPPFAGTPFEGRAFWPEPQFDRQTPDTRDGVHGFMVSALVFVTNDEIAAQRRAAAKHVDQLISARAVQGGPA